MIGITSGCKMGKWKSEAAVSASTIERLRADSIQRAGDMSAMRTEFLGLQDDAQMTREQLAQRGKELRATQEALRVKARRMDDLDARLRAQTDAMSSLRKKISDALVSVRAEDLTITERDGKIYVSLSEQLLFASGSAKVDPKGKDALGKLASVLRSNADINVLVEGHTDSIPVKSSRYADNWDLSTARAVSIVRLLTDTYSVPPVRVEAAGRGQHQPIADNATADGRARNRRTEIILVPRLDELFEIVGPNASSSTP
ncbi:MAG: OmpA family protein [Flavobacteriales bacterium]|nr:OmpA family protein [Flavobacteriales bacterium]